MKDEIKLAAAVQEAKRFLASAEKIQQCKLLSYGASAFYDAGPKETGAARRASLDLTRALADLRKPR